MSRETIGYLGSPLPRFLYSSLCAGFFSIFPLLFGEKKRIMILPLSKKYIFPDRIGLSGSVESRSYKGSYLH